MLPLALAVRRPVGVVGSVAAETFARVCVTGHPAADGAGDEGADGAGDATGGADGGRAVVPPSTVVCVGALTLPTL